MHKLNKGLMIGKFAPLTYGHLTAFSMALMKCHELTVVVGIDHLHDPADCLLTPAQRVEAVKEECQRLSARIKVEVIDCTSFPYDKEDNEPVSKFWAETLHKRFPDTQTLFGSEKYVEMMAKHWPDCLGVSYDILDIDRKTTHISATMIRNNPAQYWNFIPHAVKRYYTKNVLVLGAESCGKTTLTRTLGDIFKAPVVPEMYRSIYLDKGMDFTVEDLVPVACAQTSAQVESYKSPFNKGLVFHDTCCEITKMYMEEYFPNKVLCPSAQTIQSLIDIEVKFDIIFFCDIDGVWVNDGTRTLGNHEDRVRMRDKAYSIAVQKAKRHGAKLVVLPADYKRLPAALDALKGVL